MGNAAELAAILLPVVAVLMTVAIVAIVFWYKARRIQLELQRSLKMHEFEHQKRLKELELEIEKTKAQNPDRVV